MIEAVLVAVDGSEAAARTARWAAGIAKPFNAELRLVTVVQGDGVQAGDFELTARIMPGGVTLAAPVVGAQAGAMPAKEESAIRNRPRFRRAVDDARAHLCELAAVIAQAGVEVCLRVISGDPAESIRDEAERAKADIIVITGHSASPLRRTLFGSVSDDILRKAGRPVISVSADDTASLQFDGEIGQISTLVVPVDRSQAAEDAIAAARNIAGPLNSEVIVACIMEPPPAAPAIGFSMRGALAMTVLDDATLEAAAYVTEIVNGLYHANIDAEGRLLSGKAPTAITDLLKEKPGAMALVSMDGRTGLTRMFMYGSTDEVLRESRHPVLVLSR